MREQCNWNKTDRVKESSEVIKRAGHEDSLQSQEQSKWKAQRQRKGKHNFSNGHIINELL